MKVAKKRIAVLISLALSFPVLAVDGTEPETPEEPAVTKTYEVDDTYGSDNYYGNSDKVISNTTTNYIRSNDKPMGDIYGVYRLNDPDTGKVESINNQLNINSGTITNNATAGWYNIVSPVDYVLSNQININGDSNVSVATGTKANISQRDSLFSKVAQNSTITNDIEGTVNVNNGVVKTGIGSEVIMDLNSSNKSITTILTQEGSAKIKDGTVTNLIGTQTDIKENTSKQTENPDNANKIIANIIGISSLTGGAVDGTVVGSRLTFTPAYNVSRDVTVEGMAYIYGGKITNDGSIPNGQYVTGVDLVLMSEKTTPISKNITSTLTASGTTEIIGGEVGTNVYGVRLSGSAAEATDYIIKSVVTINNIDTSNMDDYAIYGIYNVNGSPLKGVDYLNDSVLNIASKPITVGRIGNFSKYVFNIGENNSSSFYNASETTDAKALITINNIISNDDTIVLSEPDADGARSYVVKNNKSTVELKGINGTIAIKSGNRIKLIELADGAKVGRLVYSEPDQNGTTDYGSGKLTYEVKGDNGEVISYDLSDIISLDNATATDGVIKSNVKVGLARSADVTYKFDNDNKTLVAVVGKEDPTNPDDGNGDNGVDVDEVARIAPALGIGYLNTVNLINRGLDAATALLGGEHKPAGTVTPLAVLNGAHYSYKDSDKTISNEYRLVVGSEYHVTDNWFIGLVAERGQSNYHSDANDIYGSGHSVNYGLTAFTKLSVPFVGNPANAAYLEGSVGFGKASTFYSSADIVTGGGNIADYDVKGNYFAGQIGAGFVFTLNDGLVFDTSARYLHSRLSSKSFTIEGDDITFDHVKSNRAQLKEKLSYSLNDHIKTSVAAVYEYEFNGKLNTTIDRVAAKGGDLKGSTGSLEFGLKALPLVDKNFSTDIVLAGSVGERKGVSGSFVVKYDF